MLTEDYRVRLENFEGPLDLLLFLIRRSEVEITDIPVGVITEQYLLFLKQIERVDIDAAGEFLVMAATLMEIKSRMLALAQAQRSGGPAPAGEEAAGEDPRSELVRQLLAYKAYRDAANLLETRGREWQQRFPAVAAAMPATPGGLTPEVEGANSGTGDEAAVIDAGELDLLDVVEAFRKIFESVNFDRLGEHQVRYDDTPIELHREDILAQLRARREGDAERAAGPSAGEVEFATLFTGRSRSEAIGLFLALLDLVRRHQVSVRQNVEHAIYLALRDDAEVIPAV